MKSFLRVSNIYNRFVGRFNGRFAQVSWLQTRLLFLFSLLQNLTQRKEIKGIMQMLKLSLVSSWLVASLVLMPVVTLAADFKITTIDVQGQRKIEKDAILNKIKMKEGETYSDAKLSEQVKEDIRSVFALGYFYNIEVRKESTANGLKMIFQVVEKPSIGEIVFDGNVDLKTDELTEALPIKAYEILNNAKIRDAVDKLQKLYEDKGFFLAKIDPQIEDIKKDESVRIHFKIKENDKVRVQKITFLGNQKLKDSVLKAKLATTEGGFFSFISSSGSYKQDAFDRDMQILRYLYFNDGYVQVKIDRPQVYVTPDKKSIYITIRIEEGEQFDVGDVDFAGDLLFSREELFEAIQVNKAKVFSYDTLQKDLADLQAKYGDLGYAFANVIPRIRTNEKDRKVDITFEFDKGNKVYFGKINVVGNSKTRDKVVRRELRVREGELYNETRKRESIERIQRLGFFDEVNFKTSTTPEKPDIMNVDIVVKERNTGSIQLGAGYGSATGFSLNGSVNQSNFLGKGQQLGAGLNLNRDGNYYNFNFTEPYFMDTEWRVGFDIYQSNSSHYEYLETKTGGAVRFGHPLGDDLVGSIRYKYDKTKLEGVRDTAGVLLTDLDLFPLDTASGETSSITGILEYDKRNDRFSPTKGVYASTSLEYAGVGGSLKYTKGNTTVRYFKKLFWEVVWRNNMSYSFIGAAEGGKEPPFNELYLLGGPYSLRGYRFFRVGKTKFSQRAYELINSNPLYNNKTDGEKRDLATKPFGGTKQALYQMEFEFPLIAEAGIKGVTFYDVGTADDRISSENLYSDIGFGFRWFSPIGPLRFEWGFPMRQSDQSPDAMVFDFSIGSPF